MQNFPGKLSFLAAACLFGNVIPFYSARANGYGNSYSSALPSPISSTLPLNPRIFTDGSLGSTNVPSSSSSSQNRGFIYSDAMIPIYGNSEGFGFLDVTGKWGSDHGWLGALGVGARGIMNDEIFGGYVFAERDRTALGNLYWTIVPGIELMSPRWDFHVNGYLPVGNKDNITGIFFGSQFNLTCPTFRGHEQIDEIFNSANEVAEGVDVQIGYILSSFGRTRIFGAGYYYGFQHALKLRGGAVGIEIPMTQTTSLLFRDSYDNVNRNTALFTLRVYFGGIEKSSVGDIGERLLDPIERHVGVLYTGSGIPAQQTFFDTGQGTLELGNIWFFGPKGTDTVVDANSCTFEHPCNSTQFTPANVNTVNGIASNANFYLAGGTNVNYPKGPFTVNLGQSIYGRTPDFCQPAPYGTYPIINGNLILQGNNYLQTIMLFNDPAPVTAISIMNASNVTIDSIQIGPNLAIGSVPIGTFQTGISMNNAQNVLIFNSIINAGDAETNTKATALGAIVTNSTVNSKGNTFNVSALGYGSSAYASTTGLNAGGTSNINSMGDIFNLNSTAKASGVGSSGGIGSAGGIGSNGDNGILPGSSGSNGGNGSGAAGGNGGAGGAASSSVVGISVTGNTAIAMSQAVFNLNAMAYSGSGGAGGAAGKGGTGGTGGAGAYGSVGADSTTGNGGPGGLGGSGGNGGNANGGAGGIGGAGGAASSSAVGVSASGSAGITLIGNVFNLKAIANSGGGGAGAAGGIGGTAGAGGVGGIGGNGGITSATGSFFGGLGGGGGLGGNGGTALGGNGGSGGAGGAASSSTVGMSASGSALIKMSGNVFNLNAIANSGTGGAGGAGAMGGTGGAGGAGGAGGTGGNSTGAATLGGNGGVGGVGGNGGNANGGNGGSGGAGGAASSSANGIVSSGAAVITSSGDNFNLNAIAKSAAGGIGANGGKGGTGGAGAAGGRGGNGGMASQVITGTGGSGGKGGNGGNAKGGNGGTGGAGGAAYSLAIGASASGTSRITLSGDNFNLNAIANSGAGATGGAGGLGGTLGALGAGGSGGQGPGPNFGPNGSPGSNGTNTNGVAGGSGAAGTATALTICTSTTGGGVITSNGTNRCNGASF